MADTIGRVECLNVGDDFGFVGIREDSTGQLEAFIVWFAPDLPTATLRLMFSHWFSMLSGAMANGAQVRVTHLPNSARITAVHVNTTTT